MSSSPVSVTRDGGVALLVIDNPPVNALSHAVRAGLVETLEALDGDGPVAAIVIACAGKTFVAGADIKEFGKAARSPLLNDVIARLDAMKKPVVAAIHGTALGGGLELALGCHFRVAVPSARLGLPEVKLGLLPGGGGTQRLPRAIGAAAGLRMIVSGDPISAKEAHANGLVDELAEGDLIAAATVCAKRAGEAGILPRLRDRAEKIAADQAEPARFTGALSRLPKGGGGPQAVAACIEAVRAAIELPFDEGLARERALFEELVVSDQSKAQRHLFFAEREAAKIAGLPADTKPRRVERVAVIGAGTMGRGIAIAFADAGIPVALIEANETALAGALDEIDKHYESLAERGRISPTTARARIESIAGFSDIARASDADLVVEAVFEDMELKKQVFQQLDRIVQPEAILATNTSYLDIDAIAAATRRPSSVAGMHFFSPAHVMRLVEIVRGRDTAPDALVTVVALARRLGKAPVVVGNCRGFVGNRMLRRRSAAAERLLLEGALPQQIDAAMVEFGFPMGPFAAVDLAGLDIGWRARKAEGARAEVADALCELGRFGQKTSKGFYRYEAASRRPLPDPDVEALIVDASRRLGIARRSFTNDEIVERLLLPVTNEGARILEEGIAARPGDIDVIWANGYGFPKWRGGPMFHADQIGLGTIRRRLEALATESGDETSRPAPLLARLADEGRGFHAPA